MNQTVQAVVLANQDAAIKPVVDTIPWLQHRTPAWKGGVVANELELRTKVTRSVSIQARHLP